MLVPRLTVIYDYARRCSEAALGCVKDSGHGCWLEEIDLELQVAFGRRSAVGEAAGCKDDLEALGCELAGDAGADSRACSQDEDYGRWAHGDLMLNGSML